MFARSPKTLDLTLCDLAGYSFIPLANTDATSGDYRCVVLHADARLARPSDDSLRDRRHATIADVMVKALSALAL